MSSIKLVCHLESFTYNACSDNHVGFYLKIASFKFHRFELFMVEIHDHYKGKGKNSQNYLLLYLSKLEPYMDSRIYRFLVFQSYLLKDFLMQNL